MDPGDKSQNLALNTKSLVNGILILRDRLGVILPSKRSAGVAPEVNLRESVTHYGFETQRRRQQEVQNRCISGPTKGLMSSKKL